MSQYKRLFFFAIYLNKPTAKKKSAISGRFGLIKVNGKLKKCGKSGRFMLIKVNGKLVLNKNFRFAIFLYFQRDFLVGGHIFRRGDLYRRFLRVLIYDIF